MEKPSEVVKEMIEDRKEAFKEKQLFSENPAKRQRQERDLEIQTILDFLDSKFPN